MNKESGMKKAVRSLDEMLLNRVRSHFGADFRGRLVASRFPNDLKDNSSVFCAEVKEVLGVDWPDEKIVNYVNILLEKGQ